MTEIRPQEDGSRAVGHLLCGVEVHATDYRTLVSEIVDAGREGRSLTVSAVATHGLMLAYGDPELRWCFNRLDRVVPDGQPVRRALDLVYGTGLRDRVAGPVLMHRVLTKAAKARLPVFLFGSTEETLRALRFRIEARYPGVEVAGVRASVFRSLTTDEESRLADEIRSSGARMVFVGLGCPRQEIWLYEWRGRLQLPLLAVGAAFDFHAGLLRRPPDWVGRIGLEWAFRLIQEPQRLWHRYLVLGSRFLAVVLRSRLHPRRARAANAALRVSEREPAGPHRYG